MPQEKGQNKASTERVTRPGPDTPVFKPELQQRAHSPSRLQRDCGVSERIKKWQNALQSKIPCPASAGLQGASIRKKTMTDSSIGSEFIKALANLETIGRYKIIRELGRGTSGVVYLAVDPIIKGRWTIFAGRSDLRPCWPKQTVF